MIDYREALTILAGRGDKEAGLTRLAEARTAIAVAVWDICEEEGDGFNALWTWVAQRDWSGATAETNPAEMLADEWDAMQEASRIAMLDGIIGETPRF